MKQKQIIALVSATALAATALAGCGKTSEENTRANGTVVCWNYSPMLSWTEIPTGGMK